MLLSPHRPWLLMIHNQNPFQWRRKKSHFSHAVKMLTMSTNFSVINRHLPLLLATWPDQQKYKDKVNDNDKAGCDADDDHSDSKRLNIADRDKWDLWEVVSASVGGDGCESLSLSSQPREESAAGHHGEILVPQGGNQVTRPGTIFLERVKGDFYLKE